MNNNIKRILPDDQYQAAVNANNPSATNPFLTADDFGSTGGTINFPLGAVVDVGAANSGLILDTNMLSYSIDGVGGGVGQSKQAYFQFAVPQGYGGGATFNILVQKVGNPTFVASTFINGVVDATINAANIAPTLAGPAELITLSFGSTLTPGDAVGITLSFLGTNGNDILVRGIYVNYNFDIL